MELNPKIKEMADLINADRALDQARIDAGIKQATEQATAKQAADCDLLGIPVPTHPLDKQDVLGAPKKVVPTPSPLLDELRKQSNAETKPKPLFPI